PITSRYAGLPKVEFQEKNRWLSGELGTNQFRSLPKLKRRPANRHPKQWHVKPRTRKPIARRSAEGRPLCLHRQHRSTTRCPSHFCSRSWTQQIKPLCPPHLRPG